MKMQVMVTFECGKKYCDPCELCFYGDVDSYCAVYRKKIAHLGDPPIRCPECLANAEEVEE